MCRRDVARGLVIGAGLGAWVIPIANLIAARITGRHFLSITEEIP